MIRPDSCIVAIYSVIPVGYGGRRRRREEEEEEGEGELGDPV